MSVPDPAQAGRRRRWRPDRVTIGRIAVATFGLELLLLAHLCNAVWEKYHG